jgi:hypothetical protein
MAFAADFPCFRLNKVSKRRTQIKLHLAINLIHRSCKLHPAGYVLEKNQSNKVDSRRQWFEAVGTFSAVYFSTVEQRSLMNSSLLMHPWVNVAVFESLSDGRILETFLKDRRIEARTYNDKLLQLFLFLCPPSATFRVQVRANAFRAATELLEISSEAPAALQRAIRCPSCGSLRVEYPQMMRKLFLPTVLLQLGIIFRIIHHKAYCENCHHIWNLPREETKRFPRLKVSGH